VRCARVRRSRGTLVDAPGVAIDALRRPIARKAILQRPADQGDVGRRGGDVQVWNVVPDICRWRVILEDSVRGIPQDDKLTEVDQAEEMAVVVEVDEQSRCRGVNAHADHCWHLWKPGARMVGFGPESRRMDSMWDRRACRCELRECVIRVPPRFV